MPSLRSIAVVAILVAGLAGAIAARAQAAPVTKVYSSGNLNVPMADAALDPALPGYVTLGLTGVELPIADIGTVLDVNLRLRMNHVTDASPLAPVHGFSLGAPGAEDSVWISSVIAEFGSGAPDCGGTLGVVDDEAATPLAGATPPFTGSYRGENPLSALDGTAMNGTWGLFFIDVQPSSPGAIRCWELEITYEPAAIDLSLRAADTPDPVRPGKRLKYTITARNEGPGAATGVSVVDTLPAGTTFVSAKATQGSCSRAARRVTCDVGELASGASATVTVVVKAPMRPGRLTNTASVKAEQADADTADNRVQVRTRVRR